MKAKAKKIKFNDYVPRGVFEQVRWEKDIAMQQLEELGVPFGAKVELYAEPILHAYWRGIDSDRTYCSNCGTNPPYNQFGGLGLSNFCPQCGAQMDEVIE